jgi:hypothetical protein
MEIFLTEEELEREENLFSPHEQKYRTLGGKACDILEFKEEAGQDSNLPQPPSSC